MDTTRAAQYLAYKRPDSMRRIVRRGQIPQSFVHRRGRQMFFDPAELDFVVRNYARLGEVDGEVERISTELTRIIPALTPEDAQEIATQLVTRLIERQRVEKLKTC